ncbi:MAG TPA: hypothetical protein DIS79_11195 [Bacteroidetes bacterium]|nr:hypothetical protein [Bacteroidota bacterium]HRK05662.1 hypothetical protein [Chlorobiota bacterium]
MIHLLMMTMLLTFSDTRPRSAAIVDIDTCRYRVTLEPRLDLQRDDVVVLHEACGDGDVVITKVDTTIGSTVCLRTTNLTRVSLHHCAHLTLAATAQETPAIRPFNGRYGGLLALVNDTIRRDTIDLSGYGWSGGEPSLPDVSVHDRFVHRDTIYLGGDGRGHDTLSGGRGGRPRNAGGGGGAGAAGNGGSGGHQTTCFEAGISGGRGGIVDGRGILFGSGGGGGHVNDHADARGGRGGGIVLIHTRVLDVPCINVSGTRAPDVRDDGAGGGGGGGCIVIFADTLLRTPTLIVGGGDGGSTYGRLWRYGPGGGGGGGRVVLNVSSPTRPTINITGGQAGLSYVRTGEDTHSFGAERGYDGDIVTSALTFDTASVPFYHMVTKPPVLCPNDICEINWVGYRSVRFDDDDVERTNTGRSVTLQPSQRRILRYVARTGTGCEIIDSITIHVSQNKGPQFDIDTVLTPGDSIVAVLPSLWTDVRWSTGDSTQSLVLREAGQYWCDVRGPDGCQRRSDTIRIVSSTDPSAHVIVVSVDSARGAPGDVRELVLRVSTRLPLVRPVTVQAGLRARLSVVVPVDAAQRHDPFVTMPKTWEMLTGQTDTILRIPVRIALGDSDTSELAVVTVSSSDSARPAVAGPTSAMILDGICRINGRARLVDPWGRMVTVYRNDERSITLVGVESVLDVVTRLGQRIPFTVTRTSEQSVLSFLEGVPRECYVVTDMGIGSPATFPLLLR